MSKQTNKQTKKQTNSENELVIARGEVVGRGVEWVK